VAHRVGCLARRLWKWNEILPSSLLLMTIYAHVSCADVKSIVAWSWRQGRPVYLWLLCFDKGTWPLSADWVTPVMVSAAAQSWGIVFYSFFFRLLCKFHNVWGLHAINSDAFLRQFTCLCVCVCVFFLGGGWNFSLPQAPFTLARALSQSIIILSCF